MSNALIGYILIGAGVLCVLVGAVLGVKDAFTKQNKGAAQTGLPEKFLDVVLALLKAPPALFFGGLGLLLIVLGMVMTGMDVFAIGKDCASVHAATAVVGGWGAGL
ncbi:hypothetical protein [Mycolicibacterium llatzerense]|uniref:hypothetical protein n=1 Tax=Mycolicibacterium llatzerense TaxID=280871 RepID=UPI0021B66D0D|nr:hypothetical protein [Mycolicibacterium llatzerense]MCT7369609.1 hypothetical protein [Mycolicibacterium llatzerense]